MEDEQIIQLYWDRNQNAITETEQKYGTFLRTVSWNILHSHDDADECVNDTYLRTWNAIPPTRPTAFRAWLGQIIRNLSLDRWKESRAEKRGGDQTALLLEELDECIPAGHSAETHLEEQEIAAHISSFLQTQPKETRIMFLQRYWYGDPVASIAVRFRCSESRVKSLLHRTRKALRRYLENEGVVL